MGKRWNSTNIVFTINLFQKGSKGEIFSFWWKLPKSCYSEHVSRNLYLWIGVLSMHLPFVGFGGQWVVFLWWCYCLKTSSWAKPLIHLAIISMKPQVWIHGRCGALPRRWHGRGGGSCARGRSAPRTAAAPRPRARWRGPPSPGCRGQRPRRHALALGCGSRRNSAIVALLRRQQSMVWQQRAHALLEPTSAEKGVRSKWFEDISKCICNGKVAHDKTKIRGQGWDIMSWISLIREENHRMV